MRIKLRSATAAVLGTTLALIIAVGGSPTAAQLVAGASASQAAHASKKAAHKKKAHKKKAHKKKAHKKKAHKKKGPKKTEPASLTAEVTEKGSTTAINSPSDIPTAPAFTPQALNSYATGNWIAADSGSKGDYYSKLKEITTSNVSQLKGDWMTQLDGSAEASEDSAEATPAEYNGVIYYATGTDDIFAVSVATGKILWVHKGELSQTISPIVCCGWDNRGVALGEGLVFSSVLSGSVEALNQKTGELVWKTEVGEPSEGFTVTAQPLYYEGMVFIGPVGSEYGVRGFVSAFNAKNGELLWKHYNIPSPSEYGHSSWPTGTTCTQCNGEWQHGGATVWQAPRVDPKLGLIYYSTANAGPDYTGEDRAGANLWTASTLALSYKTGQLAWGYQQVHHDIWDFDSAAPVQVVDVEVNGQMVEGVAETNKDGDTYFENAATGEPVFPVKEEPITQDAAEQTYPTEPIPTLPNVLDGEKIPATVLAELQKGVNEAAASKHISPVPKVEEAGVAGDQFGKVGQPGETTIQALERSGPQFQDSTYDPTNGYYYVCGRTVWQVYQSPNEAQPFVEGKSYSGITSISVSAPSINMGFLDAYNMHTGQLAWHKEWPTACDSGTTTTAGNLLFVGKTEGELLAFNATTGEELWKFETGAGANAAVAVYESGGKERIALYAGGNEGQSKVATEHGDNLWQFSLEGTKGGIKLGEAGEPPETLPGGETR